MRKTDNSTHQTIMYFRLLCSKRRIQFPPISPSVITMSKSERFENMQGRILPNFDESTSRILVDDELIAAFLYINSYGSTLQRAHIPYSVYTSFHPEQWGKAKMLIVSDAPNMSKENMSALKAYVEDGGIAYISGHSAQPLVEEIFGGKITGRTDETITYIAPEDEVAPLFGEYSRKYPLTVYDSAYILEGATNGKVLAKLTLPYSLQASSFLVCADLELQVEADPNDPRNESASMHSDPPGIATDYPAMMEAEVGKGKIIWACAPFESTSLTQPRKVFTSFVKKYVPEMSFASDDTPYVVEYQLWEDEEGKYLSAINLQYADEVLPVFDFNICIRTEKPAKITRVSDGREMGFEYSDGKLVLHIDRLDLYEMFDIQI